MSMSYTQLNLTCGLRYATDPLNHYWNIGKIYKKIKSRQEIWSNSNNLFMKRGHNSWNLGNSSTWDPNCERLRSLNFFISKLFAAISSAKQLQEWFSYIRYNCCLLASRGAGLGVRRRSECSSHYTGVRSVKHEAHWRYIDWRNTEWLKVIPFEPKVKLRYL